MHAFVTVGSTRFDSLIVKVISPAVLASLRAKGYNRVVVQCGDYHGSLSPPGSGHRTFEHNGVHVEIWRFKPSLQTDFENADLVISHAGSGTILEVLRLGKPLIAVPNPTLADNHQEELASALETLGYLRSSTVLDLTSTIETLRSPSCTFPPMDIQKFSELLDREMGFQ